MWKLVSCIFVFFDVCNFIKRQIQLAEICNSFLSQKKSFWCLYNIVKYEKTEIHASISAGKTHILSICVLHIFLCLKYIYKTLSAVYLKMTRTSPLYLESYKQFETSPNVVFLVFIDRCIWYESAFILIRTIVIDGLTSATGRIYCLKITCPSSLRAILGRLTHSLKHWK